MKMRRFVLALSFGFFALSTSAMAQEFVPGRPGATESAIAVPEGRWQVESELASYAHDDESDTDTYSLLETTFRYGVATSWDVEAIVAPINRVESNGSENTGFGDVTLRVRKTMYGLDGGNSLGFIGYVTLPTAEDGLGADEVEGGVIAAGDYGLDGGWGLTWTAGAGAVSIDDDYEGTVFGGVSFGHDITDKVGGYVELFAENVDDDTNATLDLGVTYLARQDVQFDAGIDLGLTDDADDVRVFVGWARRF